ncbi:MAG TPA: rhodanese-like domain-containing protein [Bacillales bacterium]|nr:rhodanese-like domain-containing protein [Bacillales bacterium]
MNENEITTDELKKWLESGEPVSIIDVREQEEVDAGKIPGARHIRMSEIPERLDELEENKEHILVCRSGRRSGYVTEFLREQGYQARNMAGGMLEWEGEVSSKE